MPLRQGGGPGIPIAGSITLSGDVTGTAAATVVSAISGTTPIVVAPNEFQWNATAAPLLDQASESTATKAADFTVTPQQSTHTTDQGGGNFRVNFQAPTGAGVEAGIRGYRGAVNTFYIGQIPGLPGYASIYLGGTGITLDTGHPFFYSPDGVNNTLNAYTSASLAIGTTAGMTLTSTTLGIGAKLGGLSTTPLAFSGQSSPNTVACGTGGTQTISAAQAIIPFFLVTTGTLSSNAVVDFSTNASTGYFVVDISGVGTITGFTLGFKNGTTTKTISSTQLTALIGTGSTALQVWTYGTNNITILT
jgi:hypothetical protein